jgi:hypothetical protein
VVSPNPESYPLYRIPSSEHNQVHFFQATARPAPLMVWVKSLPLQVEIAEGADKDFLTHHPSLQWNEIHLEEFVTRVRCL